MIVEILLMCAKPTFLDMVIEGLEVIDRTGARTRDADTLMSKQWAGEEREVGDGWVV